MRTAIYCRLSKDDAGEAENVEIQKDECTRFAGEMGWEIVGVFEDNDISAYSGKYRPGYEALISSIASGGVNCVLVTEVTRLNRQLWKSVELFKLATPGGLQRIATTDGGGFDLSSPVGVHNAVTAAIEAEKESIRLSDRVTRKKRAQAIQGRYSGGQRPFGYDQQPPELEGRRVVSPGRLVVNEREAMIIRKAAGLILEGRSLRSVVVELNQRGLTRSPERKWWPATLGQVLRSARIAGIREHRGEHHKAEWEPILAKPEWDRLQLALRADHRTRGTARATTRSYLLTGLAFCGECDARLVGYGSQDRNREATQRYFCRKETNQGTRRGCGHMSRLAAPVDLMVAEAVLVVLDSGGLAERLGEAAKTAQEIELLDAYQDHKRKLDDLVEDYVSGLLNREQVAMGKRIVERNMEQVQRQLDRYQGTRLLATVPVGQTLRETWDGADIHSRRSLIALVVEKVTIHRSPGRAPEWPPTGSELFERSGQQWRFDPGKVTITWKS